METQEQVNKTERLDMKMQEMAASIDEAVKYNATELAAKTGSPEMEELQTTGINECDLKKRKRRDWNHFCGSQNFQKKHVIGISFRERSRRRLLSFKSVWKRI